MLGECYFYNDFLSFWFLMILMIMGSIEIRIIDKTTFSKFSFTQVTCPKK